MAFLLFGLTINVVLFIAVTCVALRLRTFTAAMATFLFGVALMGAIHKTAHAYQLERGLIYESTLTQNLIGDYSIAQTMDHFGTGFGVIFMYLLWRRHSIPNKPG